jgi:hypothetical protein
LKLTVPSFILYRFCTEINGDVEGLESFKKCYDAAKAILTSIYELSGSSFEIGLLASFLNWIWSVAGRASFPSLALTSLPSPLQNQRLSSLVVRAGTLVRALALATRQLDFRAVAQITQDVQAMIGAMQANRSAVGSAFAVLFFPSLLPQSLVVRLLRTSKQALSPCSVLTKSYALTLTFTGVTAAILSALLANPEQVLPTPSSSASLNSQYPSPSGIWDMLDGSPSNASGMSGADVGGGGMEELDEFARKIVEEAVGEGAQWL